MVKYVLHAYRYGQKDFLSQKVDLVILIQRKLRQKSTGGYKLGEIDITGCRFPQQEFMGLISQATQRNFLFNSKKIFVGNHLRSNDMGRILTIPSWWENSRVKYED